MYTRPALDLLYFEDLPLGGEWLSRRRTLTETDLALYRGLAGDLNPLHVDHEHAAQSPIGLSLPGPLLGAVALGLGSVDVPMPATVGQRAIHAVHAAAARCTVVWADMTSETHTP